ncbi:MAG: hypothetical protein HXY38_15470 [Chloroflexi bacterium]|nr:hypothetical protein [Chloroflexota bacterium]
MLKTFFIDKTTGTFADDLLAAGVIHLLRELYAQHLGREPEILQTDHGSYFQVDADAPLDLRQVENATAFFVPIRYVRTRNNQDSVPERHAVDFELEKERRRLFFEVLKNQPNIVKRAYVTGGDDQILATLPPPPSRDYDLLRALNTPTTLTGYNNVVDQWMALENTNLIGPVCRVLCEMFSPGPAGHYQPNHVEAARTAWKQIAKAHANLSVVDATASQLVNPAQGKGINRPLPNSAAPGNLKSFWLLEWLKLVGLWKIGLTRSLRDSSDRKTYVPAVGRMLLYTRDRVDDRFRQTMPFQETPVLSDILTILRYTRAFLHYMEQSQGTATSLIRSSRRQRVRPADFLRGFHVAFYKDLGNAAAIMNIAFLNLPGWVAVETTEEAQILTQVLEEHEAIVRQFAENKGDQLQLLQHYRDFIVADHLAPFFDFTTAYSSYVMREGEKGTYPPRKFTTDNLRRLLVSTQSNLREILDNPGFRNIAYAIRQSTVTAQYRKSQNDRRYDVRYGLGRDLIRRAQYPTEFMAALGEFLHNYNAENAQVMETRPGPYRRSVQTTDLEHITALIDQHGSDLIAKLLVAFGYARVPRADEPQPQHPEDTDLLEE